MEIFGNRISGYTTEYYAILFEQGSEMNKEYIKEMQRNNGIKGANYNQNSNLRSYKHKGCLNNCSKISENGLEIRAKNHTKKVINNLQNESKEANIKAAFKTKAKSKRWAKRQHDYNFTNGDF